ncbi:hypothetical protein GCM10010267_39880 [Streptomyces griseorubens]|nr:hypothetical protein GCM10010267_39880 [Streptomyces griseorubens]
MDFMFRGTGTPSPWVGTGNDAGADPGESVMQAPGSRYPQRYRTASGPSRRTGPAKGVQPAGGPVRVQLARRSRARCDGEPASQV